MTPLFLLKKCGPRNLHTFRYIAVFFLGFIGGAACINLLIGLNLDKAYIQIEELKDQVSDQHTQLESLQAELDVRQSSLVKQINVHVLVDDKYVQMEIEDFAKSLLKDLIGKEVESLDPIIVLNVVNDRSIKIDSISYELKVKALLISEKIVVYIEPSELENN